MKKQVIFHNSDFLVKSEDSKVLVGYLDSTMLEVSGFS
jgi:hypothetical protein